MPPERNHHASKDSSFEIVLIPNGDSSSTRSVKASVMTIILVCVGIVMGISAVTIALIVYTPAGLLLPMPEEQLRKRYGAELFDVQTRLTNVSSEVLVLREYNNKLRKALGQKEISSDSVFDLHAGNIAATEDIQHSDVAELKEQPVHAAEPAQQVTYKPVVVVKENVVFNAAFPMIVPAVGYVSRKFEPEYGHNGIDYAGKIGSLIVAAADGYVVFSGYTVDDGYSVMISHGGGYLTVYKHNQSVLKSVGEFVNRGEPIALLGNSGRT
ncbi:MAG: M23 family metallopeptidase, partial [Bacteroidota bacterium]|nr:M23 family metallopeptidase [Bacteroidota bacterium]